MREDTHECTGMHPKRLDSATCLIFFVQEQ